MLGSLRWNLAVGASGFLLTFLVSMGNNDFTVSSLRGVYVFIALFVITFLFRFALFLIAGTMPDPGAGEDEEGKGIQFDARTPDQSEDLNELLKAQLENGNQPLMDDNIGFRPLAPKKLISAQSKDPEELVEVIRQMADKRGNE